MPGRGLDAQTGLEGVSEEVTFELGLKGISVGPREAKRGQGTAAKSAVGGKWTVLRPGLGGGGSWP